MVMVDIGMYKGSEEYGEIEKLSNALIGSFYNEDREQVSKAINLVAKKHYGQYDKGGKVYILHPLTVATYVNEFVSLNKDIDDYKYVVTALLHDIVEDTGTTFKDLINMGFDEEIIGAVKYLTHNKTIPYMDYVRNVRHNKYARLVKYMDLRNNMDMSRLKEVTAKDIERVGKYRKARDILTGSLD